MMRALLIRGMLVGLVAGILAFGFTSLFGEAQVDRAIEFEAHHTQAAGDTHEEEVVSRGIQKTLGLAVATMVYGVAFGGLFAIVYAVAHGRIGRAGPRGTAALVALGGFVAVVLVPFLKYPANPPAVGDPETIGHRTGLYMAMLGISLIVTVIAVQFSRQLAPRFGAWNAVLAGGGLFVLALLVVGLMLPAIDEVPDDFPATLLWHFRLASLGTQFVLWATLGILFGALTERSVRIEMAPRTTRRTA